MIKIYYTRTERRDASGRLIDDGSTKKTADTRGLITTRQIYDAKRKRLAKLAKSEEERRRVSFGRV